MSPSGRCVCHLGEVVEETAYFRHIGLCHDRERYPVLMGGLRPRSRFEESLAAIGIPTFSLGATTRLQYPGTVLRLARLVRSRGVAILHAHGFDATFVGLVAARIVRVPFVFTRHHSDHNIRLGARWHTRLDAFCARHADHVIAVSEATRRIMTEIEGVPAERITVVYNGVAPPPPEDPERLGRLRLELGLGEAPVCLMIARLHEEKGHRFLFEALPEVRRRSGPLAMLLVGEGPHREEFQDHVRRLGLTDVVRFLGWRNDVPDLIGLSTLVVLPSLAESFGQALAEAMSLGKPVVASTTGGIPEVVVDGETGLLVPPAASGALGEALCRVLGDPLLARSLGEAGRRRASRFSYEGMARGYEGVYDEVLRRVGLSGRRGVE